MGIYEGYIKRFFDMFFSGIAIICLSPLMIIVAILVRFKLGSPVFFRQERPGKGECIFRLYKFRTMTDEKDENGDLLSDEKRTTAFGRFIRTTSLDELPELFNIFKGDMSIVGPRPLLVKYLPYYKSEERIRHTVRPGLTGLAQINGRNNLRWDERLALDVEYVKNIRFLNDCRIVFKTIGKVLNRSDIATGDQLLMDDLDVERAWMHGE